jgi:Raf kinase inhibitor-like YbhB/YbcL family protein
MKLFSPAFQDGERIPREHSRYGQDKSPPLKIADVPSKARSLVLIMDDPDATRGLFTHWVLFDIDPNTKDIPESHPPQNARHGTNDWAQASYGGPKPPSGDHRYFFRLHALDTRLDLPQGSTRAEVEAAMKGHVIEQAVLMGRFAADQRTVACSP